MPSNSVAIVGFGKMGILHSAILGAHPDSKSVGIVEPNFTVRRFARKLLPRIPIFKDFETCIAESNPRSAFITTPTGSHVSLVERCLKQKISPFVEKPLGISASQCQPLAELAQTTGIPSMVGYSKRFVSTFKEARRRVLAGDVGLVERVHASALVSQLFSRGQGWRYARASSGGGSLAVIGCHVVDLLRWCFGEIASAKGTATSVYSEEVEDEFEAEFRFANGIHGTLRTSWSAPGYRLPEFRLEFQGSQGSLAVTDDYLELRAPKKNPHRTYKQDLSQFVPIDVGGPEYTREDLEFLDCVVGGRETSVPIGEGYRTQQALEVFYRGSAPVRRSAG